MESACGASSENSSPSSKATVAVLQSSSASAWPLWERTLSWTFESARAFLHFNTQASKAGHRVPRLGSCWGGWDCNNPSYAAPAHYRAFRSFMLRYGGNFGVGNATLREDAAAWDSLIGASYSMLVCHTRAPTRD